MQLMRKLIIIFIFANMALAGNAQIFQISGKVADENEKPVEFAEVLLLQNSAVIQYQLTDENGAFAFSSAQGKFGILIRQLGDTLHNQVIDVMQNTDLGKIKVRQNPEMLQGANVIAQRKLVERRADRMVFNVVDLPGVEGGDVTDVLKITPGLVIDNDIISIIGKDGTNIMINDRPVMLSGEALLNFLKGLRANDIQSIEVITTPPAKYEAEGNGGLINIVMKKSTVDTWSASIFGNLDQAEYAEGRAGGSFSYRKNILSFYLNASYYLGKSYTDDETAIFYPELRWEDTGNTIYKSNSFSARTGFDLEITDKWTAGIQYLGNIGRSKQNQNNQTDLFNITDNSDAGLIMTQSNSKGKNAIHSGNLYSIIKLDTLGKKINLDFDILTFNANSDATYRSNTAGSQDAQIPNGFDSRNNILDRKINNYSAQIDVEHPFKKVSLNYGAKFSYTRTDNDIHVFDLASGTPVNDPGQTNRFLYRENMQALYISGNATLGKWELQFGLRGENTHFTGHSVTMDTVFKKSYFKLFPTAYLTYNHNDKNTWYAEYGRRIYRHGFQQLNPFRSYLSPYYYFEGNPELLPIIDDNFNIGYVYKSQFQIALDYTISKDNSGGGIVLLDDDGYTQKGVRLNYYDSYEPGVKIVYIFNKLKWWTSQNSVNAFYQLFKVENLSAYAENNERLRSSISSIKHLLSE